MFRSTKGASKQRRDLINAEIGVLRDLLPLPEATRQRLSQLQIMSLACVYIRKCNFFSKLFGDGQNLGDTEYEFSQAMTGFLLVASRDGRLLYISENVTEYLGHSMVDMMTQGDSIYDIIDKRDHPLVQKQLMQQEGCSPRSAPGGATPEELGRDERAFFCRMNVARSFRRHAGFGDHKMMYVRGHFIAPTVRDFGSSQPVFMAICTPLITPDVKETTIQNSTQTFYSVHGLDMKYTELGHIGQYQLGYTEGEINGKSWYELLHPEDILEAKDKHVQLIKSSHEMGCVITARLQHKAGHWVWTNIVMHIRQPFVCDNGEPAIVCINQVIDESEAQHFKIQSQMYSSQIARSPEFLGSQAAGVQHVITQVPVKGAGPAGQGGYAAAARRAGDDVSYEVNFVAGGSRPVVSPGGGQQRRPGQKTVEASALADSGSEYSNGSSSEADSKQALRADIISRLKRKMSESAASCKPEKIQRLNPAGARSPSGAGLSGGTEPSLANNGLLANRAAGRPSPGSGTVQVLVPVQEVPIYRQLALKNELVLGRASDGLPKIDRSMPALLQDAATTPLTPLTPDSLASDLLTDFQPGLVAVDVLDSAVVPPSVLTPDASPASMLSDEVSTSPPPHVDPSLEYGAELPTLDDLTFFEEPSDKAKSKPLAPVPPPSPQGAAPAPRRLPVIDAVSLETMLYGLEENSPGPARDLPRATAAAPCPTMPSPLEAPQPSSVEQPPKMTENDEQLLDQVTNVLMKLVQQAADGSFDLSQLILGSQQLAGPAPGAAATPNPAVHAAKTSEGLVGIGPFAQLGPDVMSEELDFSLDDISQITQLEMATPNFGDCDLSSSLLAQNL